ncbi:glycosyltransferase family 2 protein [Cobetia sp. 3AK]|uniref:glycosyltransferase family 2 protein n=1 Tax=Cobetia sp. 3AK TaxID=3040020 RepID=UPI0024478495|nr:glycosyltransferase family 2 protein [Cobetia sp. 3AK]MDH2373886.1 glycosyltransferase family 2 protein [Cobetia sp. 3AK]
MSEQLKISVVTACFNSEATIGEAIATLKRQTWKNIEHVVIDGASKDNTVDVAKATLHNNDVFISEPDKGIYDALNKGVANSTGDIVGFLHSDDLYAHDEVLAQVARYFEDPAVGAVYGDLQYVSATDTDHIIRHWKSGKFKHKKLKYGWMPPHPTFFMRRELYEVMGGFDLQYRIAGDYDALLRYLSNDNFKVCYLPEVLVKMRVGGASNGSFKQIVRKSLEDISAMRKNGVNPFLALPYKNVSKISQFMRTAVQK